MSYRIVVRAAWLLLASHVAVQAQDMGAQRVSPASGQPSNRVVPLEAPALDRQPAATGQAAGAAQAQQPQFLPLAPQPTPMPMPSPLPARASIDLVNEAIDSVAPLSAEEIIRLRQELDRRAKAAATPLAPQAKPTTRVVQVDLSPGAVPEVIRISRAEGSIVSFIDAAGRPWPVENADNFNPKALDIALFGKNSLSIGSKVDQAVGNIAVRLEGMSGALTFRVLVGHAATREVDYTVDMQIPRYLPGAPAPVGAVVTQPAMGVDELMDYLLRTPPRDAKSLKVEGLAGAMAWQTPSGRLMLRTDRLVLSPNAKRRQSSSDGMTVYDLPLTPVVLVSDDARIVNVQISGFSVTQAQSSQEGRK